MSDAKMSDTKTVKNFLVAKGSFHPESEKIKDAKWRERDRLIRELGDGAHPDVVKLTQDIQKLEKEISRESKAMEKTHVKKLANAIYMSMSADGDVSVRCIGGRAINNAVKSMIIASGYCKSKGIDVCFEPSFDEGNIGKLQSENHVGSVTAILFKLKGYREWVNQE